MSGMSDFDIEIREAVRRVERHTTLRDEWMQKNDDIDGEPVVDWRHWDERMADFNERLAEAGEGLSDVVRKMLGPDE